MRHCCNWLHHTAMWQKSFKSLRRAFLVLLVLPLDGMCQSTGRQQSGIQVAPKSCVIAILANAVLPQSLKTPVAKRGLRYFSNLQTSEVLAMQKAAVLGGKAALCFGVRGWQAADNLLQLDPQHSFSSIWSRQRGTSVAALGFWGLGHDSKHHPGRYAIKAALPDPSSWQLWFGSGHPLAQLDEAGAAVSANAAMVKNLAPALQQLQKGGLLLCFSGEAPLKRFSNEQRLPVSNCREEEETADKELFAALLEWQSAQPAQRSLLVLARGQALLAHGSFANDFYQNDSVVFVEDLISTLAKLEDLQWPQAAGRQVSAMQACRLPAISHVGNLPVNLGPARLRHAGSFVLQDGRILRDGLNWFDAAKPDVNLFNEQTAEAVSALQAYEQWWQRNAACLQPDYYHLPADGSVLELSPAEWRQSRFDPASAWLPAGSCGWQAQDWLGVLKQGKSGQEQAGSVYVDLAQAGRYEFKIRLLARPSALAASLQPLLLLQGGVLNIVNEYTRARMPVQANASELVIELDLQAGKQQLDIWLDGQRAGKARLSPGYVALRYKGKSSAPKLQLKPQVLPDGVVKPAASLEQ